MRAIIINSNMLEGRNRSRHQGQLGLLSGLQECGVDGVGWGSWREQAGQLEVDLIITSIYNGDYDYAVSGAIKAKHVIPIVAGIDSGDMMTQSHPLVPFVLGYAESPRTSAYYDGLGMSYHVLPFGAPDIPFCPNPPESPFAWVFAGGKSHRGRMWDDYISPLMIESHKRAIPFLVANENEMCVSDAGLVSALDDVMNTTMVRTYYPGWESETWETQYKRVGTVYDEHPELIMPTALDWGVLMHRLYPGARVCPNVHCPEQKQGDIRQDANQRLFDIPASSGLQVCDGFPLMENYFEPRWEILDCRTPEDWIEEVILASVVLPREMWITYRRRGWERVQREHLWRHRAATLLGWLKEATG